MLSGALDALLPPRGEAPTWQGVARKPLTLTDPSKVRLALYQPDIPQNLGASLRLAACLGVAVDIIEPCGFPLTDKALRRTAMDYGKNVEIIRHDGWSAFRESKTRIGGRLILFTTRGATTLDAHAFQPNDTLLFGRESAGVPDDVHAAADARVRIPLDPAARSLNVAMSAGIALWEALRQTGGLPRASACLKCNWIELKRRPTPLIPTKVGTHGGWKVLFKLAASTPFLPPQHPWVPAFAGMSGACSAALTASAVGRQITLRSARAKDLRSHARELRFLLGLKILDPRRRLLIRALRAEHDNIEQLLVELGVRFPRKALAHLHGLAISDALLGDHLLAGLVLAAGSQSQSSKSKKREARHGVLDPSPMKPPRF